MTDHNELVRRLLAAAKPERVFAGVSSRGAVYRTDKPKHHAILREAATAISAAESRAQAAEAKSEKLATGLSKITEAWEHATHGRAAYERDLGWTGSNDNPAQIFAWYAALTLKATP